MQLIIADARLAKTKIVHVGVWHAVALAALACVLLVLAAQGALGWLPGAPPTGPAVLQAGGDALAPMDSLEGAAAAPMQEAGSEPVQVAGAPQDAVSELEQALGDDAKALLGSDAAKLSDAERQERIVRANIDAMARKLGEMQARVMQLESLAGRVAGLAGVPAPETATAPGQGGALVSSGRSLELQELRGALDELEQLAERRLDLLTVVESRLLDQHVRKHMLPTQLPVAGRPIGSPFGWRIDPLTGRSALHTGLDFPAPTGTPIHAAAAGVVVTQEFHAAYGNMVEVDHGNNLITRYAHASKTHVKVGDLVRRGQKIAEVGTTGRSTGPHLHFEVWLQGVAQDPKKFLAAGESGRTPVAAASQQAPAQR